MEKVFEKIKNAIEGNSHGRRVFIPELTELKNTYTSSFYDKHKNKLLLSSILLLDEENTLKGLKKILPSCRITIHDITIELDGFGTEETKLIYRAMTKGKSFFIEFVNSIHQKKIEDTCIISIYEHES